MRDPRPDLTGARWFTSSFSDGQSQCVEVALAPDVVGVRDTKQRGAGPTLVFATAEWSAFVAGVKAGEFDRP
jgi:hypothetical protein